ncbi:Glutathione transferase protein [Dioscorea alata]|uniref:Glutathione transferase protein n=1 Tax=Dioscorea alata TaxID=55571 RepID=A0ACB7VHX8_DIOAL|nr:Glutathione transferase protein [Dioscorea alata]
MEEEKREKGVILLDFWVSPFSQRLKIAMDEKNVEFECIEEDIPNNKSQLLLKSNPVYKKIPVLIHDGKPICESMVILRYIDEVWPHQAPLLPSDPYSRAIASFWADFIDKKVYDLGTKIWMRSGEVQETAKQELLAVMKTLEGELGEKEFFGGDVFGFVDITLVPFYAWFHAYEIFAKFSFEEECPKIVAWAKRCMQRDSVCKALPEPKKVYEYLLDLKATYNLY